MAITWKLQPPNITILVHAALIWIGLFAAEVGAEHLLRHKAATANYYFIACGLASVLCGLVSFLGNRPLVKDIQEICLYDVFVQLFGLYLYENKVSPDTYLTLSQLMIIWKGMRVTWPIYCQSLQLPTNWPPFGVIGILRAWWHGMAGAGFSGTVTLRTYMVIIGLPVVLFFVQQIDFIAPLPLQSLLSVLIVFGGTWALIARLEQHEEERLQTARDLGIAEGEAAAQAKSVAELTAKNAQIEQQAAELAVKNAQLEQQALELAANNRTLEALAAERAAMMEDLAARNISLRDANHDYKVPMLELMTYVERAQELATDDTQAAMLSRLDRGLDELRTIMGDIIEQAKVSTELTTPPLQRLEVADLVEFFYQRFEEKAEKRGVEFDVQAPAGGCAVFTNELLLRRIITNLANNAIMYAESGREVEIRFRCSPSRCYVRVKDTGPGIPMANGPDRAANFTALIERIKVRRQPITAYADEGQGHGLGLQIIARLCGELGTSITLQSRPGLGTVFRFSVPLAT